MSGLSLAVIMAGLPARGKTFLALRLHRYLEWQGYRTRVFNAGAYRREILGPSSSRSSFFDPKSSDFARERERIAKMCFNDLALWLKDGGGIAVYDATNVTPERRAYLKAECERHGFGFVFVENICDDEEIIRRVLDVKLRNSPDYEGAGMDEAREDFAKRVRHYESVYRTVEDGLPHIKVINFGQSVMRNYGEENPLLGEIAEYLGSLNLTEKDVYITRHGESLFNLEDRIGGDSSLTEAGMEYASRLGAFFRGRDLAIFTSAKKRSVETASLFGGEKIRLEELNEINSGTCDSMSYGEIALKHPEIREARKADKFAFRYPGGESYMDLIQRVKKAVMRIERERRDVLVISHRAVNRCLFSYFIPVPPEDIPYIEMPLNRVIRVYHKKALYGYESLSI